jgi:EAL domain-containing protein (putative c-di-GMP-specific phosphodiesterase class I)
VLHGDFVAHVADALAHSGIDPSRLTLQVTETVLLSDVARAATQLRAVRALGVRVAVDDFGTGYTSIAHLRAMPVDEIKIDQSFVAQLPRAQDRSLVQIVNQLARHLGVTTVAEGVETPRQACALREAGCDNLQGYLFSPPRTAADLEDWLAARYRLLAS